MSSPGIGTIVWKVALVGMLRYLINDMDTPYTYTDDKLKNMILYGAFLVDKDISFGQSYTFDLTQLTITPDPVINKDFAFINLSILKAAVVLARNQLRTQVGQAVKWKDGQSSFDGTELYKSYQAILTSVENDFNQAWMQYQFGDTAPGRTILTAFSSDRICFGGDTGLWGNGTVNLGRNTVNFGTQGY